MIRWALSSMLLVAASGSQAHAQDEAPKPEPAAPAPERPWAKNVSKEAQAVALDAFRSGNQLFATSNYTKAVAHYERGLASWDHPALHGNLAVALIRLERPLEAFSHIGRALQFGQGPLDAHVYEQLITSQKLLENQLARIEVVCASKQSSEVSIDGDVFTKCPENRESYALAGSHELVARKADYLTLVRRFTASPGEVTRIEVSLTPLSEAVTHERRFATWKPWAVVGAGVGLSLVGAGFKLRAVSNIDAYDQEVDRLCPDGCERDSIPSSVADLETRASLQDTVAIGSFVAAGATLAAGAVLVYMNRPKRIELDADGRRIGIAPTLAPGHAGLQAVVRF